MAAAPGIEFTPVSMYISNVGDSCTVFKHLDYKCVNNLLEYLSSNVWKDTEHKHFFH